MAELDAAVASGPPEQYESICAQLQVYLHAFSGAGPDFEAVFGGWSLFRWSHVKRFEASVTQRRSRMTLTPELVPAAEEGGGI